MPDQRSLTDQLKDLIPVANDRGLYDAADFLRTVVERTEAKAGDSNVAWGIGPAPLGPDAITHDQGTRGQGVEPVISSEPHAGVLDEDRGDYLDRKLGRGGERV